MSATPSSTPSSALSDLVRYALLADRRPWYPGLAVRLVREFGRKHGHDWVSQAYGTHRWMSADVRAPRNSLGAVSVGSAQFIIELLPETESGVLDDLPLAARPAPETTNRVQTALDAIAEVDGLATTVGCLVRACHVLAADRGYDVSHSTPELPLSIFVSIPAADERDAVLRLAESIVHEAMHLQLTLVESIVPLVQATEASAFSPWKQSTRPVQGLLHGLYVFAVIHDAFDALAAADPGARDFANRRRAKIASEVSAIGDARDGLTPVGVALWDRLIASVRASAGRPQDGRAR